MPCTWRYARTCHLAEVRTACTLGLRRFPTRSDPYVPFDGDPLTHIQETIRGRRWSRSTDASWTSALFSRQAPHLGGFVFQSGGASPSRTDHLSVHWYSTPASCHHDFTLHWVCGRRRSRSPRELSLPPDRFQRTPRPARFAFQCRTIRSPATRSRASCTADRPRAGAPRAARRIRSGTCSTAFSRAGA